MLVYLPGRIRVLIEQEILADPRVDVGERNLIVVRAHR